MSLIDKWDVERDTVNKYDTCSEMSKSLRINRRHDMRFAGYCKIRDQYKAILQYKTDEICANNTLISRYFVI
jgi:hypothetical protein